MLARTPATDAEALPALALSRPAEALRRAETVLSRTPGDLAASYAHQAVGIVLRDRGDTDAAVRHLRLALRLVQRGQRTGADPTRAPDVRATLGATLAVAGHTREGLRHLDAAAADSDGLLLARVLMRRAFVLGRLGRHDETLDDLRRAVTVFRDAGDDLWEARALTTRARTHLERGALTRAAQDFRRAEVLFTAAGQELEADVALHNRGAIAYLVGDLPGALSLFAEAGRRLSGADGFSADLAHDRCELLLAVGLADDALEVADRALADGTAPAVVRAHLQLAAATAAFTLGDLDGALDRGRAARALFRRQQREWWRLGAELLLLRVREARGERGARIAREADGVAQRLVEVGAADAPVALLLAARLAPDADQERAHLAAAARHRRHPSPLVAATGWLALARARELDDDRRGVLGACGHGLDALDAHRTSLGSSELRALSTRHGSDLAALALRHAAASGSPRRLLGWSERWRATSLAQPPVRPPAAVADDLGRMRLAVRRLDALRESAGADAVDAGADAERHRRALEREIRDRRHRLAGSREPTARLDLDRLLADLGGTAFVELVDVDGTLRALVARAGRVRGFEVGPTEEALAAVAAARFVLRQVGRGRPADVSGLGARLERALLGRAAAALGDGPVVVSPPGRLHATPWGLLPSLAGRPVSVAPSAATWQRAAARPVPSSGGVVLVAGPGLASGGGEIDVLARDSPGATVLRGSEATVGATLASLDGARLAHVATHGHFRPDSPMFSSLLLDDGPLTVHDLELLHRAPYRFVLSACDSGVMVPVGADELLGLSAALLSMGTAGVASSVAKVNDETTAELMVDLHRVLAGGGGLAEALLGVRDRARGDRIAEATAAAFVGFGV